MIKRLFLLFLFVFVTSLVKAYLIPLTIEERTVASDAIVSGTITDITSYWDPSHTTIYSIITIEIDEQLRGDNTEVSCEVHMMGGTVGNMTLMSPDNPQLHRGEKAIFFLSQDKKSPAYQALGLKGSAYQFLSGYQSKISFDTLNKNQIKQLRTRMQNILHILK